MLPARRVLALLACLSLCMASPTYATQVSVQGLGHCSSPPGPTPGAPTLTLPAGVSHVEWISGAWSLWSSNGENGGLTWVGAVRAYIHATAEHVVIGPGSGYYASVGAVEAVTVGSITNLTLSVPSQVTFFVTDGGGCGDNRGTVVLDVTEAPVPVASTTWGRLRTLYASP